MVKIYGVYGVSSIWCIWCVYMVCRVYVYMVSRYGVHGVHISKGVQSLETLGDLEKHRTKCWGRDVMDAGT